MLDTLSLLTLHLARAYGVVVITVALAALFLPGRMQAALADFERSPGLAFLAALFAVILGLFMVTVHTSFVDAPAVVVSLLGWLVLIKGILLLAAPEGLLKLGAAATTTASTVRIWGVIALILGAVYLAIGLAGRALVSV
jgi:hypothetical protein